MWNVGLYISPSENSTYHEAVEQIVLADQLGYESVWLTEKHFDQGHLFWSSPLITAGYLAAKTQRMKIGFAACVSTLHHPVRLAEDFANLDMFSRGRLIIGLTRTSLSEHYHEVFQSPMKKAWKKFDEQFDIMQKLWLDKFNRHSGSFYKIPAVKLYPSVVQKPLPPIFFIANNDASIVDAARKGVGIFLHTFQKISDIKIKKKLYEDHFIDVFGLGPQVVLSRFTYVGTDSQQAIADIQNPFMRFIEEKMPNVKLSLEKQYKTTLNFDFFEKNFCIFGDTQDCMQKLNEIADNTGIKNYTLIFNFITLDHQKCVDSMKRLAARLFTTRT